jgi:hypothetical protein
MSLDIDKPPFWAIPSTIECKSFGDNLVVGFEGLDGGGLVVLHEATVTGNIGAEDGGKLAVAALLFHADTSLIRRVGRI